MATTGWLEVAKLLVEEAVEVGVGGIVCPLLVAIAVVDVAITGVEVGVVEATIVGVEVTSARGDGATGGLGLIKKIYELE